MKRVQTMLEKTKKKKKKSKKNQNSLLTVVKMYSNKPRINHLGI